MRNQYKVLVEKYDLIKESFGYSWNRIDSYSKEQMVERCLPNNIPLEFIDTLESDLGEQFGEYVKKNNLLAFEGRALKYLYITWDLQNLWDFTSFKMEEDAKQKLKKHFGGKEPTESQLLRMNAYTNSLNKSIIFLYNHYQKWYKEVVQPRLNALNKDNPGIEMDI
jgi:hypothetical protein